MGRTPKDAREFQQLIMSRHSTLMAGRPEVGPGVFKKYTNRVGSVIFVDPDYVEGTLAAGFEATTDLESG